MHVLLLHLSCPSWQYVFPGVSTLRHHNHEGRSSTSSARACASWPQVMYCAPSCWSCPWSCSEAASPTPLNFSSSSRIYTPLPLSTSFSPLPRALACYLGQCLL